MKILRRKHNIFEQMDLEIANNDLKGPVESFILSEKEWYEFKLNAHNHRASFKKIEGRDNDPIGGDWTYKGALIRVDWKKPIQ